MADELWNAGDKVRLTGSNWALRGTNFNYGDIVTLRKAYQPGEWFIQEEGGLYVQTDPESAWGATKVANGGSVFDGPGFTPGDQSTSMVAGDAAWVKSAGEVRTTSSTGGEKGVKPEAWALLPSEALEEIARVYDFGARKYAAHNWRKGYEWNKSFSALCRHIFAWWRGEDLDPESNLSHLAHAGFHVLSLLTFWLKRDKYGEFDDRYSDDD